MVGQPPPDYAYASRPSSANPEQRDPWADEISHQGWDTAVPRATQGQTGADAVNFNDVPPALRPGGGFAPPTPDTNVWDEPSSQPASQPNNYGVGSSSASSGIQRKETNPFLRKKVPPSRKPVATEAFANLDINDTYGPPASVIDDPMSRPPPKIVLEDFDEDPWKPSPSQTPPAPQQASTGSPNLISFASGDEPAWGDVSQSPRPASPNREPPAPPKNVITSELTDDQAVWDDLGPADRNKDKGPAYNMPQDDGDDWNIIDADPDSPTATASGPSAIQPPLPPKNGASGAESPAISEEDEANRPTLPPRQVGESSRWVPSRQPVDASAETYQIKNIEWYDNASEHNPRVSPILVQNANGPCPLVALVNALTLTTPTDIPDPALVHVLRSREQVSLNLLLDAVFDELMSPRRTGSDVALPDVSDLYAFLMSLHTGMNVNPRFVPTEQMINAYKRTSLTHLHPAERADLIPGTFENTHEMSLYATFSIPLIHGWLPPRSDPVYDVLSSRAAAYEDAQNLLFREEELEDKLLRSESGLTEDEQELYQDIITIKSFLQSSATQLTPWGIEVIGKAIRPGTFAILFRNDHFSTLYCHPQTMQLFTLVTDAGYRGHDQVVWESLVDVNGEHNEFLAGNFKVVGTSGNVPGDTGEGSSASGGAWTTVDNSRGKGRQQPEHETLASPTREQEDRDLALALQLQEEEDEQHRAAEARRRRESLLSEQYIEQQARQPGAAPGTGPGSGQALRPGSGASQGPGPRRGSSASNFPTARRTTSNVSTATANTSQTQEVRPLVPPRRTTNPPPIRTSAADEAPPTYEQASASPAFNPPVGHPAHAGSSLQETSSTSTAATTPAASRPQPAQGGRLPAGAGANAANGQNRDRDCVVM